MESFSKVGMYEGFVAINPCSHEQPRDIPRNSPRTERNSMERSRQCTDALQRPGCSIGHCKEFYEWPIELRRHPVGTHYHENHIDNTNRQPQTLTAYSRTVVLFIHLPSLPYPHVSNTPAVERRSSKEALVDETCRGSQ